MPSADGAEALMAQLRVLCVQYGVGAYPVFTGPFPANAI